MKKARLEQEKAERQAMRLQEREQRKEEAATAKALKQALQNANKNMKPDLALKVRKIMIYYSGVGWIFFWKKI